MTSGCPPIPPVLNSVFLNVTKRMRYHRWFAEIPVVPKGLQIEMAIVSTWMFKLLVVQATNYSQWSRKQIPEEWVSFPTKSQWSHVSLTSQCFREGSHSRLVAPSEYKMKVRPLNNCTSKYGDSLSHRERTSHLSLSPNIMIINNVQETSVRRPN